MRNRLLFIVLVLGLGLTVAVLELLSNPSVGLRTAHAVSYTVCPDGPPTCGYSNIQVAVDAASDGDVIKVAAGTYTGVNNYGGSVQVVYIDKSVTIRGGYITTNWTAPDAESNPTILNAQRQGRVLYITGNVSPTIEGLRITGGSATGLGGGPWEWVHAGGGVYVITATVTISGCEVINNTGPIAGGGVYLYGIDNAVLRRNTVSHNAAEYGGGLYLRSGDAEFSGNVIVSNSAGFGGGLRLYDGSATLSGNTVSANTVYSNGGGLALHNSDATLVNNVIANNWADIAGGGLYIAGSSSRLLHTTVARNSGGERDGICITNLGSDTSSVVLTNTILVGHTMGITVASRNTAMLEATLWGTSTWANTTDWGGAGMVSTGTINLWGDPAFADPDAGDYHIGLGSAALDAGVDVGVIDDIDGNVRVDGLPDLGADELVIALLVTKRANPDQVEAGAQLTYTIRATNTGVLDLHATVTDTLPDQITLGRTSGGMLVMPGQVVTWTPTITAPGGVWMETIVVTVEADNVGPLTNLVEVTTEEGAVGGATVIVNAYKVYLSVVVRDH